MVKAWGTAPEARGVVSNGGTHPNEPCSTPPQLVESAPPLDTMQRHFFPCVFCFLENISDKKKEKKQTDIPMINLWRHNSVN